MPPAIQTIIADEPIGRTKLRMMLDSEPGIRVVAECENGNQTLAGLREFKPDLILLDVQMPDADAFQILEGLSAEEMPMVIFTAARGEYAIRAFEAHALDYILKPFDQERLHIAIERARVELFLHRNRDMATRIVEMLSSVETSYRTERRLAIKSAGRVIFLDIDEIDWVEAAANYVKLNAGARWYLLRQPIGRVCERLDPHRFVRIHRSTLVNVQKIKELQPCNSGEYMVILSNGKELACSRTYKSGLHKLIESTF